MIKQILLAGASALALTATSAEALTTFSYTGAIVHWSVPTTGLYTIDAWGAGGGSTIRGPNGPNHGGAGAALGGQFHLTAGDVLTIAVGGHGADGHGYGSADGGGGGGGGSGVALQGGSLLILAGGGGGGGYYGAGGIGRIFSGYGGAGGSGGHLSICGSGNAAGGGGGGFNGPGAASASGGGGGGGGLGGVGGGAGIACTIFGINVGGGGGFGGGGGGGAYGGGGGGGYFGGNAGALTGGGGGGSFDGGADVGRLPRRRGDGKITISASAPEPDSWSLMLSGLGFLGYVLRRRVARRTAGAPL